ncbi:MAG: protein kinase [Gemmatimonadaceae bacterium]|nr:protein kinase [Gemmatimonadaceae bacterium]
MTTPTPFLRERLQDALGPGFVLGAELGGGGMSRVFRADETALRREIVVKLLSPELAAELSVERFMREIRLAASLQQANIVPLLQMGTCDGLPWYTMPFVDGRSLRAHLREAPPGGGLPLADVLRVLRDIGRALAYAHARGVVHRDIKLDNLLLSGGTAVVTDFGIAKAIGASQSTDATTTLTRDGHSVGSPAYMAPEQIAADPEIDGRADLYALGCLAYELLTGRPPFAALTPAQTLAAHLTATPERVTVYRPDTPPALAALVQQCLEKLPAARPASARDVLTRLESISVTSTPVVRANAARSRWRLAGVAVSALVLAGVALWSRGVPARRTEAPVALAVLPYAIDQAAGAQQYLADGVTEELIGTLSRVPRLQVIARSMAFRHRGVDARTAAQALDVSHVLTGSIRRGPNGLHVTAELMRADGTLVWSETFDRDSTQLLPIEQAIVQGATAALGVSYGGRARDGLTQRTQDDPVAHDLYMRGRFFWSERSQEGMQRAIELYRQANDRDPRNTRVLSGLADAYAVSSFYSYLSPEEGYGRAKQIAQQAIAIDSTLAEPVASLGYIALYYDWAWDDAGARLRRSIALDSSYATAHQWYGNYLLAMNRPQEALVEFTRAERLDPANRISTGAVCWAMMLARQYRDALAQCQRALDLDSTLAVAYLWRGQTRELLRDSAGAMRDLEAATRFGKRSAITVAGLAHALATFGRRAEALVLLRELEAPTAGYHPSYEIATVYAALGDQDQAVAYLERARKERSHSIALMRIDPALDRVRSDPRVQAIAKQVGLP